MVEDAPVNTGAVAWPDVDSAVLAVRRMQVKLQRWAIEDPDRRFGHLFNLVYDPALLVHAWERVAENVGARTSGIDRATVATITTRVGVASFLTEKHIGFLRRGHADRGPESVVIQLDDADGRPVAADGEPRHHDRQTAFRTRARRRARPGSPLTRRP